MRTTLDPIEKRLANVFLKCLSESQQSLVFSSYSLFSRWFRGRGTPFYFLFHKNLSRTNIQFAELISLIRLHTKNTKTKKIQQDLHFVMVNDFLRGIQEVIDDLIKSKPSKDDLCTTFLDLYSVLRHTILLDILHGSCSVFFPPHMKLDLFRVCSESGYIHSCGYNIYSRDLQEADDISFKRELDLYLNESYRGKKIFFVVYSHEDFTRYDRKQASDLRGGLDDVKISAEKYYIGNKSLVRVLQELKQDHVNKLCVAEAGDYHHHKEQQKKHNVEKERTIWLMVDRVIGDDSGHPGERQFLICYDQLYKNDNPLQLFDENKPAWVAHTTIPHTLAGAMVNITRPIWPSGEVNIYDPFCGTGTTALEALKFQRTKITCNDISPIAQMLLYDNLTFFGQSNTKIKDINRLLESLSDPNCVEYGNSPLTHNPKVSPYNTALKQFDELEASYTDGEWFDIPQSIVDELEPQSFEYRLRFYLALRTKLRHAAAFARKDQHWVIAYREEARLLAEQVSRLYRIRSKTKQKGNSTFLLTQSAYSAGSTVNPTIFQFRNKAHKRITFSQKEATVPPNEKFDLIITDPPYGFNNEIANLPLATLLAHSFDVMIDSLKPCSQLVIALPDRSHSGRHIPLFATRTWVTQQIIAKAENRGFEAISPASILPSLGRLFQPPYYWKSEKALTRAILHFYFRKKATPQ